LVSPERRESERTQKTLKTVWHATLRRAKVPYDNWQVVNGEEYELVKRVGLDWFGKQNRFQNLVIIAQFM